MTHKATQFKVDDNSHVVMATHLAHQQTKQAGRYFLHYSVYKKLAICQNKKTHLVQVNR
jgi:hypothetical protein